VTRRSSGRFPAWTTILILIVAGLAAAGCGGDEEETPMKIDWDLSERHTLDETSWPKGRLDSYTTSLEPLESVRIRVPGDVTLQMSDRAKRVILYRRSQGPDPLPGQKGRILDKVEVYTEPMPVEEAYRTALTYADQFGVSRAPFDDWLERRKKDVDPVTDRTGSGADNRLGADGPFPLVELQYSPNEERPWGVMVQFYWPPPKE